MEDNWSKYREKIIGLGEHSFRKSYYPELQEKIDNLEASQRNLSILINSISDGIIILDNQGSILSLNTKAQEIFNLGGEDALNSSIFTISSPSQKDSILTSYIEKVRKNIPQVFEWLGVQLETKEELELQISMSPTIWNGEPAIVAVVRDFHERKKYEKELRIAKEKAEVANDLKTEFIQNLSHEIRTPMNGIIGFSKMLDNPALSHEKRGYYATIIQNSSLQLLKIINDILAISTLEAKQESVNESEFSLNAFLMELFAIFSANSRQHNVPLYIKKALPDKESHILSDKAKLTIILSNLLENAFKFTREGYIEFGYQMEGEMLVLYVKDTGIGISQEKFEVIFERFAQEEKETANKHGGLGLGLSISKENAKLLGGNISVDSEKGKGSAFFVRLPFKPSSDKHTEMPADPLGRSEPNSRYTVLVAEDEEVNFLFIRELFNTDFSGDFTLIHAKDGREAVDYCLGNPVVDLVLMDIKLPLMNGYEALKIIKSNTPHVPVIAQTAYAMEKDKERALEQGFDGFIPKPLDRDEFFRLVSAYLKMK